jgi:hypothetical protein
LQAITLASTRDSERPRLPRSIQLIEGLWIGFLSFYLRVRSGQY